MGSSLDHIIPFPVTARRAPVISNGRLGMMLLVGTETVLFSSFIGAYLVLRMGASLWPPAGAPKLEIVLPAFNTLMLVVSSIAVFGMRKAAAQGSWSRVGQALALTFSLGTLFVALQVIEFEHVYRLGLTLKSGPYGALFYSLIACHALHVLGGLGILLAVWVKTQRRPQYAVLKEWAGHAELYWHFVTAVWLVLFGILYLA